MGEAYVEASTRQLIIRSNLLIYGNCATDELAAQLRDEVETMWNEAQGRIILDNESYIVQFKITAEAKPSITELEVLQNTDPRNNYFRVEEFVHGSISFVDGLKCNSGYFLLENLYKGSTTAAHEYGHTLGLDHPENVDIRGKGVPGIMYPRGTLVDAQYQYDPSVPAGLKGGTMHPMYRKVKQEDIQDLKLHKLDFESGRSIIGEFTNIYHWNHAGAGPSDMILPPVFG